MTGSIFGQLALKDLYLTRWIVLGSIAAGAISLAMMPFDVVAFYVGSVSFVCVLIVLNIFLVTSSVMQEKKDKVRLFVLSLPISPAQYTLAKMAANLIAFLVPWLSLTAASLVVIAMTGIPDGLMPIAVAVSTYILSYFCVLLSVAIVSESQLWPSVVISHRKRLDQPVHSGAVPNAVGARSHLGRHGSLGKRHPPVAGSRSGAGRSRPGARRGARVAPQGFCLGR